MARGLLDRADDGSIGSNLNIAYANAVLNYREHHYREALVLLDRELDTSSSRLGGQFENDPAHLAYNLFLRALLDAELERTKEAVRDFARAQLKLALGDKPGHDRGDTDFAWVRTYQAETRQREAEAVFKAKGIPLPEPDAK